MPNITVAAAPYLKPLPLVSDLNRPFWDGLRDHEFRIPRCTDCGDWNWVPYPACRTCQSENQIWTPVSGEGTLYSFTVVYRGPGAFDSDVPYVLALGQLAERPRVCTVFATLADVDPDTVRIGMPIEIGYVDIPSEDTTLYQWRPR